MTALPAFLQPSIRAEEQDIGGSAASTSSSAELQNFEMTCQEDDQWCWAAVTQAIARWRGESLTQVEVASWHISPEAGELVCANPPAPAPSCGPCKRGCTDPHSLGKVLDERDLLVPGGDKNGRPSFKEIQAAIKENRPVPVRIAWNGSNSGHFICVTGYVAGERVRVHDPLEPGVGNGPVQSKVIPFEDLVSNYQSQAGESGKVNYYYQVPTWQS